MKKSKFSLMEQLFEAEMKARSKLLIGRDRVSKQALYLSGDWSFSLRSNRGVHHE